MGRLSGRVAIVTGAGQGIGRGIALVFAREGARVVIGEIKEHRGRRTADEIVAEGGDAFAVATDVADRDEVFRLVDETIDRYGTVDILVNNAQAMHARMPIAELTDDQVDVFWLSGLKGTLWAMQAVYPAMKEKAYGRIINFVSTAAIKGEPGLADYNATKEGIRALTKTAAREWGRDGITVNCIAPGAASKRGLDFAQREPDEFARRNADKAIPRLGDPEADIAPVAVFLAGEESRFVTGQTIFADGGDCLL